MSGTTGPILPWPCGIFRSCRRLRRSHASVGGIRHYNESRGIPNTPDSGYHETLTLFWAGVIRLFLEEADPASTKVELVNRLLVKYGGNKDFWREYYSFDLLKCEKARRSWVEPDRKSLSSDDAA
jgi:hypothetical protein